MNKFNKIFALLFVGLFVACMLIETAEAGKKKKEKIKNAIKSLLLLKLKSRVRHFGCNK